MLMVQRTISPESAISLKFCLTGSKAFEQLDFMIAVKSSLLLLTFQAEGTNLRHSPDLAGQIASSLRSGVVLAANRLLQPLADTCDSLIDGPFCSLVSDKKRPATGGLLLADLWDDIPNRIFNRNYKMLSEFAQTHWSGSTESMSRKPRISKLVRAANASSSFHFSSTPLSVDSLGFAPSGTNSEALYNLNSNYGYISFLSEVSVFEMKVRAPLNSHVLVRSFNDGISVWSRVVHAGESIDVARPCNETDPSIEAIDYIEIIGFGAELVSFSLSHSSDRNPRTFLFLDSILLKPSRYSGIRSFPSSAYLVDMETAATEGLFFAPELPLLTSAIYDPLLSSDSLIYQLERADSAPALPVTQIDYFIRLLERQESDLNFETCFRDILIESAPEVMAFLFKPLPEVTVVHADSLGRRFADRITKLRGDLRSEQELEIPQLVLIHATKGGPVEEAANTVAIALMAHLGKEKFESIVLRSKLERMTNSQNVSLEGVDEPALVAVIAEGFGIPLDGNNKRSVLAKIVDILLENSEARSAGTQLVDLLLSK
jgi:hypothetical protein